MYDYATGLPLSGETTTNGTPSAATVQRDKQRRDAAPQESKGQHRKTEVVPHQEIEFEILDL